MAEMIDTPIEKEMQSSYIDYAMSVIIGRALPDVRDGLKPAHRRTLYAMYMLNNVHNQPTKKSAKIIGEIIGNYHPHGDLAAYETLVRMAQDFSINHLLVEGQGNMGCFTKDTKIRLADGRDLNFEQLIEEQSKGKRHWTFALNNDTNLIEITEVKNPRLTRRDAELLEVILDNGERIRCTPDHRFLLHNGTYKQAKDLSLGTSLMPLYIKISDGLEDKNLKDYEMILQPKTEDWQFTHQLTPEIYNSERKNNRISRAENTSKYFGSSEQILKEAKTWNHKVKSVTFLREKEDVYDITTDPWHNFSLSAGIFVHNSIDGDRPAAQRYTEVRLTKLAEELLEDLDKNAVKMVPNFDNTREEPILLPSKVPNLLINGSSGIAVGVATNIMPHNLSEICDAVVAYVTNPIITSEQLLNYVKGPDLPTGGMIFNNEGLLASYVKGRGTVIIRGKVEKEKIKNKEALIVTEIPYTVNKATLVAQIAELVKDKRITGISDMRDESGKEGIRIVIELKQDAEQEYTLNQLYKHSQLQISLPVMNIAVLGNSLLTLTLKDFIKHFVEHRINVIKNRSTFDLNVAKERIHLVEGLLIALEKIESIVALIKASKELKDARASLVKEYSLSEKQANAILDMKLSKLTSLERGSLETEKTDLRSRITELESILADPNKVLGIIKTETKYLQSTYGRPRRTVIDNSTPLLIEREDLIQDDDMTIILTRNNYIKRIDSKAYREQARGGKGIIAIQLKEGDFVKQIISCRTKDYLLILSNTGRAYWLKAYMVPEEGRYGSGKAAVNLVKFAEGEKAETIINTRTFTNSYLTFITSKGKIKKVAAESFSHPRANGIRAINMQEGDTLADVCLSDGKSELFIATRKGKALRFSETDLRPMGREAVGVRAIRLAAGDAVLNLIAATATEQILSIAELGFGKITALDEYRLQKRGGKGVLNIKIKDKTGFVIRALNASQNGNVVLINSKGVSISFPTSEIRVTGRAASGVRLMKMDQGVKIVDAQILPIEPVPPKVGT